MLFEYLKTETYMDSIEIEDIGNCKIVAFNDESQKWMIDVSTKLGWTTIRQFGPLNGDTNTVDGYFSYLKTEMEYKDKKIYKIVYDFINNPKRNITQVFECSDDDIQEALGNIIL